MIFNSKTEETNLVKLGDEYIERVWNKGKEKNFKLVGIHVDEKLKWDKNINNVARKKDNPLYGLSFISLKTAIDFKQKLLHSGVIHSHLVYGLPILGFSTQGKFTTYNTENIPYRFSLRQASSACPN